jgi:hypothetical protein
LDDEGSKRFFLKKEAKTFHPFGFVLSQGDIEANG